MISRIVEVSSPAFLSFKNRQVVIELRSEGKEESARVKAGLAEPSATKPTVPIEDLGVLILDNHSIVLTQQLLSALSDANVAVVLCDAKHMPSAQLLPLSANATHTEVLRAQFDASEPLKKQIWKQIVQAKILAQADTLAKIRRPCKELRTMAATVGSGDPQNVEGRAAALYFQKLFGREFVREREAPGVNTYLNYGYIVLRAATARAVVATGLHPALGVHHRSRYNPFCLVDDLIEPLRPLIDEQVASLVDEGCTDGELTPEIKKRLLTFTVRAVNFAGKSNPLMTALHLYAASCKRVLCGEIRKVTIPSLAL